MNEDIIGIEVKGEIFPIKDDNANGKIQNIENELTTLSSDVAATMEAVQDQGEIVTKISQNIGETDIQELEGTVESHSEELTEISEELPKIKTTLETLLFSKLKLLKKGENGTHIRGYVEQDEVDFNISDWDSYIGVVLVHSQYRQCAFITPEEARKIRELKTFLKDSDGSLTANLYSPTFGERMVNSTHKFIVDPSGGATLYAGYSPKEGPDSESDENQDIIPVFEIYGILKEE